LPSGPDPVHLFAENFDVEMWNSDRIMEIGLYGRGAGIYQKIIYKLI
jgi:hypothetical protein